MHSIELTLFCSDVIILKYKILEILKGVYVHISIPNSNSIKIKTVGMTISSLDSWLVTLFKEMIPYKTTHSMTS